SSASNVDIGLNLDNILDVNVPAPNTGDFLEWNGIEWVSAPGGGGGGLTLPYSGSINTPGSAFAITNSGSGAGLYGENSSSTANARGVYGKLSNCAPGALAAAVYGECTATGNNGVGVYGAHGGDGYGV